MLIFSDGYFKLADFGFSRRLLREQKLYSEAGTVFYLAPELLAKTGYGYSADLWSFGVVLY